MKKFLLFSFSVLSALSYTLYAVFAVSAYDASQFETRKEAGNKPFHAASALTVIHKDHSIDLSDREVELPENVKKIIMEAMKKAPQAHQEKAERIMAEFGKDKNRGLASYRSIYLGVDAIETDQELSRVFLHELGHVVDLGYLTAHTKKEDSGFRDGKNIIYISDKSLDFYNLCWNNSTDSNNECDELDFVSQYAASDPFEDFAESYLLFLENNKTFLTMTEESNVLKAKYDFLTEIFPSIPHSPSLNIAANQRIWDMTKVESLSNIAQK
ncbi:hypothetical protein COB57_05260 [Candidatus Peregrinibacteria bacterium]|nr:MAG: hypothetical protein COB57_05260 [Candidatus Peregrinibacteria bacterium]